MNSEPKYCSNCGQSLENLNYEEIKKCPKCKIDLQRGTTFNPSLSSVVDQLPYKSPGTAALIAFIGGIFGLQGVGHIYVGKVGKGIGILISGIIIAFLLIFSTVSLQGIFFFEDDISSSNSGIEVVAIFIIFISGIAYLVLWIWQIFNARKLAKKFNEIVRTTGKEPW
ncbi:MAG TPA: zinc ribbon domain-containing protein [Nitrososphaeraceae archaeon]|nr:zinc ribbon domain-containing protein [Nitrososphaeraceae archaeon]